MELPWRKGCGLKSALLDIVHLEPGGAPSRVALGIGLNMHRLSGEGDFDAFLLQGCLDELQRAVLGCKQVGLGSVYPEVSGQVDRGIGKGMENHHGFGLPDESGYVWQGF